MTLNVETGTAASDSDAYCSLEYANAYNAGHLDGDSWSMEDVETQERAIRLATRRIDGWIFFGRKRSPNQALEWPRTGMVDSSGWPISANVIPNAIKMATAELARRLVAEFNAGALSDDSSAGAVKQVTVGPIGISFDTESGGKAEPEVPDDVVALLRHFGYPTRGAGRMGRLVR